MKIQIAELTEQDKKERKLPKVTITFGEFKNMKIQINDQQPLDEVVKELSRIGYESCLMSWRGYGYVVTESSGEFSDYTDEHGWMEDYPLTTLAELKEM